MFGIEGEPGPDVVGTNGICDDLVEAACINDQHPATAREAHPTLRSHLPDRFGTVDVSSVRATPPRSDVQPAGWPPGGATPAQSGRLPMRAVEAPRTPHRPGRAPG